MLADEVDFVVGVDPHRDSHALAVVEVVMRRQALEEELARAAPPFDAQLDKAEELLADFGRVWRLEDDPAKRRRLLATLFDRVWQDGGTIVAVKPREAFLRYFQTADELARRREKRRGVKSGSDGTRTRDLRRDRWFVGVSAGFTEPQETPHQAVFGRFEFRLVSRSRFQDVSKVHADPRGERRIEIVGLEQYLVARRQPRVRHGGPPGQRARRRSRKRPRSGWR